MVLEFICWSLPKQFLLMDNQLGHRLSQYAHWVLDHWKLLFESCLHPSLSITLASPFLLKVVILWAKPDCLLVCMLNCFSRVHLFATYQLQPARLLCPAQDSDRTGVGSMQSSRSLPNPEDQTHISYVFSCTGRLVLYLYLGNLKPDCLDLNILLYSQQENFLQKIFFALISQSPCVSKISPYTGSFCSVEWHQTANSDSWLQVFTSILLAIVTASEVGFLSLMSPAASTSLNNIFRGSLLSRRHGL